MTLEEKLSASDLLSQTLTAERDDLRATVERLTIGAADELTAVKAEAVTKEAVMADLTVALEAAKAERDVLTAKVAELDASKATASKQAADIVASTGVEPSAVTPGFDPASKAAIDHLAVYSGMTDAHAKSAYFAKHAQAIYNGVKL